MKKKKTNEEDTGLAMAIIGGLFLVIICSVGDCFFESFPFFILSGFSVLVVLCLYVYLSVRHKNTEEEDE